MRKVEAAMRPGSSAGGRPLCRANVTSPHPHRSPPECARSAGNTRAPPGHRPCPAASTRSTMLVTLKTLQQQTFKIDIDSDETVRAVKEKIESEKGKDAFPVAGQTLI